MNYIVLYEAVEAPVYPFESILLVLIPLIAIILYAIKCWKNCNVGGKIGLILIPSFLFIIFLSINFSYFDLSNSNSPQSIWNEYINGNYKTVEGVIDNYTERQPDNPHSPAQDNFTVNDVYFHVGEDASGYGYPLRQRDGGVLKNGQKCIIHYVETGGGNIVMKIQIEKET